MKKRILFVSLCLMSSLFSCDDSPLRVCAACTEQGTGVVADDFCGNVVSVDAYISTLENTAGQDWHCTKY